MGIPSAMPVIKPSVNALAGEGKSMSHTYEVVLTDTFCGEANYAWVDRATVCMSELTHYGYDGGTNYCKANRVFRRELMRKAKEAMGLTGVRGVTEDYGDELTFRPYGRNVVMFVNYVEG